MPVEQPDPHRGGSVVLRAVGPAEAARREVRHGARVLEPEVLEDVVRDVALALQADDRIAGYIVEAENFESIHNHSAYALIEHDKRKAR